MRCAHADGGRSAAERKLGEKVAASGGLTTKNAQALGPLFFLLAIVIFAGSAAKF